MKKKVALLLVLSMLMSMLPMNVFGAPIFHGGTTISGNLTGTIAFLPGQYDGDRLVSSLEFAPDPISVHIPLAAIEGMTSPIQLTFAMTNSWAMDRWGHDIVANITTSGSIGVQPNITAAWTSSAADVLTNWHAWGTSTANVTIPAEWLDGSGQVVRGLPQTTRLNVTVMVRPFNDDNNANHWREATMSLTAIGGSGTLGGVAGQVRSLVQSATMVGTQVARSVSISATGAPRGFTSALLVPPIRITESMFDTIEGDLVIRLTAPQFYNWAYSPRNIGNLPSATQATLAHASTQFGRVGTHNLDERQLAVYAGGPIQRGMSFRGATAASGVAIDDSNTAESFGIVIPTTDRSALRRLPIRRIEVGRNSPAGSVHATDRHRIDIHLENIVRNPVFTTNGEWLEVRNLWLVPDEHAATFGDVNIDVAVGRHPGTPPTGAPTAGWVWDATANSGAGAWVWSTSATTVAGTFSVNTDLRRLGSLVTDRHNVLVAGQTVTDLHVGTRGQADLNIEVVGGPEYIRTGTLGTFRAQGATISGTDNNGTRPSFVWNRDNEGLAHWSGVQTATLIIEEDIAGGFGFGFGSPINFEFLDDEGNLHPGVRILGIEARAGNNRGWGWTRGNLGSNFYGGPTGIAFPAMYGRGNSVDEIPGNRATGGEQEGGQNWMNFRGWVSQADQRFPSVGGVGRVSDTIATVYLPSQTIRDVAAPGHLEVRFWLSVEAGYEWKYGQDIDVTISGTGVANFVGTAGSHTVTIAHARDPIAVNLTSGSTPVSTGTLYNIEDGVQSVSDVVIDVVDNAAFPVGSEIWVYVGTDTIGRNFDINLVNVPTATVNPESGLRLDTGRLLHPGAAGHVGRAGVAFTVTRQPYGGNSPAPVITISNINVEGQAFPGIEYQIIVSGTDIARNDQEVHHAFTQRQAAGVGTILAQLNRGIFTSLPYNETILENVFGGVWDTAPDAGLPTGGLPTGEFRMWEGMGPVAGVDEPFRWVNTPGTRLRVGFVSARAFAYFINGSPDQGVDWNASTNTATISGTDTNNNPVTVVMTVGSNFANVNGQPHDIAAFAGQSGPDGSIQVVPTPDGRIFLPLRFLANAFGRTVHAEGEVVVFR